MVIATSTTSASAPTGALPGLRQKLGALPRDSREPGKPGKLRLLYEANPMSFLIEQADGAATNGHQRIMEIMPTQLHERVAVILGSKAEVERVTSYHREHG